MKQSLDLRKSHKYVGTWKHLDEWEHLGELQIIASRTRLEDEEDYCEPEVTIHLVKVRTFAGEENTLANIKQALRDSFTSHGCSHEHDCCGCRSYYAGRPRKRLDGLFVVRVSSSRNY